MPSDVFFKAANGMHRAMMKLTGGRFGWDLANMPVVELTTTGRKSGKPRSVMLTSPIQDGATIVLVGSRGGDDHHPAWVLNIRDNPDVEVSMRGKKQRMHAHIASPEERAELWPRIVAVYKNYDSYQTRTTREIPLVVLEPST